MLKTNFVSERPVPGPWGGSSPRGEEPVPHPVLLDFAEIAERAVTRPPAPEISPVPQPRRTPRVETFD